MIVPDEIRKCVVYLGAKKTDGTYSLCGTGFFISKAHGVRTESVGFMYLVTARHVIDGIKNLGCDRVCLRVNMQGGSAIWTHSDLASWRFHADSSVDVAVCPVVNLDRQADHMTYPSEAIGSIETMKLNGVGLGDEIFVTGLFSHHTGKSRNIPIVRAGNIAAMPEERIYTDTFGPMDAYLIEMRSIGGISGSPVFAYLGPTRTRGPRRDPDGGADSRCFLFGLIHGHFDDIALASDSVVEDAGKRKSVNEGIAIVVPGEKILEVIDSLEFKKVRESTQSE